LHLYVCFYYFYVSIFFVFKFSLFLFCLQTCISLLYVPMFVVYCLCMSIFFIFTSSLSLLCLQFVYLLSVSLRLSFVICYLCVSFFRPCIFAFASQFITTFFYNGCSFFPPSLLHWCFHFMSQCCNSML
jgi:hypothetical protein